jgi:site-specific recombinase XerD
MADKIDTVTARGKLKPRRGQYWHRISKGAFVGYRKMTANGAGTWWARSRDEATGKQTEHALGTLEEFPDHQRFDKATAAARDWFDHLGKGGSATSSTISAVCARYVEHLRTTKPKADLTPYAMARRAAKGKTTADVVPAAEDAAARFKNYVLSDANLASTDIAKLTPTMLDAWRKRLQAAPTRSGGNRGGSRTASTLNRDMSCFRAALNLAYTDGLVTSDFAWRGKLLPIKDADRRRELYLDKDQRRRFIEKAPADLAEFLRGLSLLPLRPGALAGLTVGNFDKRLCVLTVGSDKAGRDRKIKLPKDTAKLFDDACADKAAAAPIFSRADGRAWDKDGWKWPIKAAAAAAKLPEGTTAYTLRHSTISDLVHAGLDLLTVAQISGTSVRMIEQHYGHLRGEVAADALAKLAL